MLEIKTLADQLREELRSADDVSNKKEQSSAKSANTRKRFIIRLNLDLK